MVFWVFKLTLCEEKHNYILFYWGTNKKPHYKNIYVHLGCLVAEKHNARILIDFGTFM
jgi:hypothetical protein